jgi:hypothetical protein
MAFQSIGKVRTLPVSNVEVFLLNGWLTNGYQMNWIEVHREKGL